MSKITPQKSPFGGELGKELEKIWRAIKANQVQPSPGIKVTRTTNGTTLKAKNPAEE